MKKKLIFGFMPLPIGALITPMLPELGVPIILLSTRLLQDKYEWARQLNVWIDKKFALLKAKFRDSRKKR
jgi:hypothetical protein